MIQIINSGLGNVGSIRNMLHRLSVPAEIVTTPEELKEANKIILPGVGAFDTGMECLANYGWLDILNKKVLEDRVPVLGICLGMQLMTKGSEEGRQSGLGWIDANTKKFNLPKDGGYKIPHMGWNVVNVSKTSKLLTRQTDEQRFYFVHSYYVALTDSQDELTSTNFAIPFTSSFERGNILGVQFHPEKSHKFGMQLLRNFVDNY